MVREEFERNWLTRMVAALSMPILKRLLKRIDLNNYNGASLLGLQGVVIKSHGGAGMEAFKTAIIKAIKEAETNVPEKYSCCSCCQTRRSDSSMKYARIAATGSYLPTKILTNHDLATMVDTNHEWIVQRTGIKQRHIVGANDNVVTMAAEAARQALAAASMQPQDIDMIIVATCSPDHVFPSAACLLQAELGVPNCPAFDVQAACSGFMYALTIAMQFITAQHSKRILLVGSEAMSKVVNWQDRASCILFGDGGRRGNFRSI